MFKLILVFSYINMLSALEMGAPTSYSSLEECNKAGEIAKENYNGYGSVSWTCVPLNFD